MSKDKVRMVDGDFDLDLAYVPIDVLVLRTGDVKRVVGDRYMHVRQWRAHMYISHVLLFFNIEISST